ncbi:MULTISPECIES: hypothetical protein [Acinetobacter calcoaceticus/baumannii complex]|uniref:hypothetical protein n=1 Tax=Acinetobacter calcoaceticus/baumannii complex TaxID=909768 RepID=UPI00244C8C38|nr:MULTISPECIES: hypothetical protein [Acinetobacter calcoaceticus/baumannii complex]MDH2595912.1 hypothetical protein [Acinetobacter baumannii]MDO7536713.1 hypothetical protein [Acinetobacter pittii]
MKKEKNKIQCTICKKDTSSNYGLLLTKFSEGGKNKGSCYKNYLCRSCLFNTISHLQSQKRVLEMFEEDIDLK